MDDNVQAAGGCHFPPELDDLALIAAIDGEADAEVVAHLRTCPHCAGRARHFADLQGLLRQQFFRMFCPASDTLVAFQQGLLAGDQYLSVATHVAECPYCGRELQLLKHLMVEGLVGRSPPEPQQRAAADPPLDRPRRVIARPLPRPVPALAGAYRGAANVLQYAYNAENLQITIGVRRLTQRTDRRVVVGTIESEDSLFSSIGEATVSLLQCGALICSAALDDLGNFVLDDLVPGIYRLALRLPDREVVIEALTL